MVARLQAQAREVAAKARMAAEKGDQPRFVKLHGLWKGLMKQALNITDPEIEVLS